MALVSSLRGRALFGPVLGGLAAAMALLCTWAPIGLAAGAGAGDRVDFNFQIRPLLSDRCFKCHGPDEKSRKAKLRLDSSAGAYAVRAEGMRAIVPGRPA